MGYLLSQRAELSLHTQAQRKQLELEMGNYRRYNKPLMMEFGFNHETTAQVSRG